METWARKALGCCRLSLSNNSGGRVEDNADVNRWEGLSALAQVDQKDVKNLQIAEVRSKSKLTAADKQGGG